MYVIVACTLSVNNFNNRDDIRIHSLSLINHTAFVRYDLLFIVIFQVRMELRTPAWHRHRHELAQGFMDRYVRRQGISILIIINN